MPSLDDRLSTELERAARPAAPDLERAVKDVRRRRARRSAVRRVRTTALAVAVLTASAAGFLLLRSTFGAGGETPAQGSLNGDVVFVREEGDPFRIYVAPLRGANPRLLAEGIEPDVSPDGTQVAFVRGPGRDAIATIPIGGGQSRVVVEGVAAPVDPEWSPDGTSIAYVRWDGERSQIWTVTADGSLDEPLAIDGFADIVSPSWSPDGRMLAFAASRSPSNPILTWDLFVYDLRSQELRNLTATDDAGETAVAWSPDGTTLAFERHLPSGRSELWTMTPSGSGAKAITSGEPELFMPTWAPDGTALLASDGDAVWLVDPRSGDSVRLFRGRDPSWQPTPPTPDIDQGDGVEGRDIGLEFRVCGVERTGGLRFGPNVGTAWTGIPVHEDGTCPRGTVDAKIVAVDHTGDGLADVWWGSLDTCDPCRPLGGVDLDVDGFDEIVVQSVFSIQEHWFFRLDREGASPELVPILVAPPGHEAAGLTGGEPLTLGVGGDEGFSGYLRCETYPESPILVYTTVSAEVDATTDQEVHESRLNQGSDGMFHVVDVNDFTVPKDQPVPLELSTAPACGLDFHPNA